MTKQLTALIDADMIIFKAAAAAQKATNWADADQPELWSMHAKINDAKMIFHNMMGSIEKETECTEVIMCISDKVNFRKGVNPEYKSNRKDVVKPMLIGPLQEYVKVKYDYAIWASLEADDVMGIMQSDGTKCGLGNTIIVSGDKDMKTIAGRHYNHLQNKLFEITEDEADLFFHQQILMGDMVDGYAGLKGVGEVTAAKILAGSEKGKRWDCVLDAFYAKAVKDKKKQLKTKDLEDKLYAALYRDAKKEAIMQAQMARILHAEDWDNGVILWTPEGVAT